MWHSPSNITGEIKGDSMRLNIDFSVIYGDKDINNIIRTALEGGINYWCEHVEVIGEYLGEHASEQISLGGTLIFYSYEDDEYELTLDKFIDGLTAFMRKSGLHIVYDMLPCVIAIHEIDIKMIKIDAKHADTIIQHALFGDIVYKKDSHNEN